MKYSFLLFAFMLSFLSSCSIFDSNDSAVATGALHKIEVSTWMYGTHTLDDASGRHLYALTSSNIDLNAYENKQVEVWGNLVEGYPVDGGPQYLNVTNISVIK